MGKYRRFKWIILSFLNIKYILCINGRKFMKKKLKKENLNIAMIGHKVVPSRRGGIELVLTTLCPLLVKKGLNVVCFNRSGDKVENEYINTVKNNFYKGVQLKKVWTFNKKGLAALTSSFTAAICATFGKYDVIHFHAEGPSAALFIPKLLKKRCIVTVHGLDWQREKWKYGFASKYIKFGEKVLAKYADEIIVLSKGVQQYFKDTYNRETNFIPNGVNRPKHASVEIIKNRFGLQGDDYFLCLSRLTEEKGIHYLIDAYKQIKTDRKLIIAGDTSDTDDYVDHLKEMAKDNSNIIFTGFVSGELLDSLYSNAYVYVLPSNLEGMPLSLLEAMSYGNCIIGSDIPEIADVLEDKGILFKKSNIKDLKEKLQFVNDYTEIREKYKKESSDFICSKYNWNEIADRTIELYRK
ncbi:glycosyltransferase family 4 protein [Clostridium perfringens]|uniref:glycosyltransferase family 4 protein n=1 Tax=Clostridium perfringens TaxID=1502 RepID=UPI003BAA6776